MKLPKFNESAILVNNRINNMSNVISFTYDDIPDNTQITEDGEYVITIKKAQIEQKGDKEFLTLMCNTEEDETVFDRVAINHEPSKWKLQQILRAIEYIPKTTEFGITVTFNPEDLIESTALVKVKMEDYVIFDSQGREVTKSGPKIKRWKVNNGSKSDQY